MAHVSATERRPQLIKAAIELMTREGVAAGSTRAIATELGVAQATVHYTFGTKEGLYRAVMEQLTDDLVSQVRQSAPATAGFEETLCTFAAALFQTLRDQPKSHQLLTELTMFSLHTPPLRDTVESHFRGVIGVTAGLVAEAAARTNHSLACSPDTIARFVLAGFDGITTQHLALPDEDAEYDCFQALVSAAVALAGGKLHLAEVPRDRPSDAGSGN